MRQRQLVAMIGLLLLLTISTAPLLPIPLHAESEPMRDIHIFTLEFKTKINGQEKELYRWDPGTIVVKQGEKIRLHLHGFHGKEHSFSITGYPIKESIRKGETVSILFEADKPGMFELICHTHQTKDQHGPMIGYIVVLPK